VAICLLAVEVGLLAADGTEDCDSPFSELWECDCSMLQRTLSESESSELSAMKEARPVDVWKVETRINTHRCHPTHTQIRLSIFAHWVHFHTHTYTTLTHRGLLLLDWRHFLLLSLLFVLVGLPCDVARQLLALGSLAHSFLGRNGSLLDFFCVCTCIHSA
jgi:hypothetical protein